jgi:hypothetical protein
MPTDISRVSLERGHREAVLARGMPEEPMEYPDGRGIAEVARESFFRQSLLLDPSFLREPKRAPEPPKFLPHPLDNPKVTVLETTRYGRGVFAKEKLRAGEVIAVFHGHILQAPRISLLPNDAPDYTRDHVVQVSETEYLHGKGGLAEMVNHSCDPNCGIRAKTTIVAMRDILPGEELSWDYAMTEDSDWYCNGCQCGTDECRGTIGPYRDLPAERQYAYRDFTSDWLLQKHGVPGKEDENERSGPYVLERITSEQITQNHIREITDFFIWIFANDFAGQYLFYPSMGTPISAQEAFGVQPGEYIDVERLKSFSLEDFPRHPQTGEQAVFWIDPEVTARKLAAKLKKDGHAVLVRSRDTGQVEGFIFGHKCTLREAFETEEWQNPHGYSRSEYTGDHRKFDNFLQKIQGAIAMNRERFAQLLTGPLDLTEESEVYIWNCFAMSPGLRAQGLSLEMIREFFALIPMEMREKLFEIGEPLYRSFSHHMMRAAGARDISGVLQPGENLQKGDQLLILGALSEFASVFSLPREEYRRRIKAVEKSF